MFQKMPNPDNVPGLVSTGYQRQNTNMYAIQTGIDTTEPRDDGTAITIPVGGVVEFNGTLFKITSEITLQKPVASRAYWIALTDNGNNTASTRLVERPGKWYPAKQGCYLNDGSRTLNYVSLGDVSALGANDVKVFDSPIDGSGNTIKTKIKKQLPAGWYLAKLQGGAGGGDGGAGVGGIANKKPSIFDFIFFHKGKKTFNIKIGGNGYDGVGGNTFGGGGGGGEKTTLNELEANGTPAGKGGGINGGINGNNGLDGNNSTGLSGGVYLGGLGGLGGGFNGGGGGGGGFATNVSNGGNGGNGGLGGEARPEGEPGGSCNIYSLTV